MAGFDHLSFFQNIFPFSGTAPGPDGVNCIPGTEQMSAILHMFSTGRINYSSLKSERMKKQKHIHHLIIVDASGSMERKVPEVQGGLNAIFRDLKAEEKEKKGAKNRITVTDFSSHGDFNVLYKNAKPGDLEMLADGDYSTRAMTALYDAIGKSFQLVPEKADAVLVTIFTDGFENDSKEFDASAIKKLIGKKQEAGWTVTFMGTSKEAMLQAHEIGIPRANVFAYEDSRAGTEEAFLMMNASRKFFEEKVINDEEVGDLFEGVEKK